MVGGEPEETVPTAVVPRSPRRPSTVCRQGQAAPVEVEAAGQMSPPPGPQEAETQPRLGSNSETGQKTTTTASPGGASKRRRVARKRTMRRLQAQPTCRETCVSRCPREKRRLIPSLPPEKRRREVEEARKRVPAKRPDRLHQPRPTQGLVTSSFFFSFLCCTK